MRVLPKLYVNLRLTMASLALLAPDQPGAADRSTPREATTQAALWQFMTHEPVADFMAAQFDAAALSNVRLLDAGAGQGALSQSFARRWSKLKHQQSSLAIDAFEIDSDMVKVLRGNLDRLRRDSRIDSRIISGDFIAEAVEHIRRGETPYTHAILNPPYKKIGRDSSAYRALTSVGVGTVNLYSGFVALSLQLLEPGGELVAIIPRSFCNGPYYKPFRQLLLSRAAIQSIHLFAARDKAFQADKVLQENVIIRLRKGTAQGSVQVTTSTDATFADLASQTMSFDRIVVPGDGEQFIHIPVVQYGDVLGGIPAYRSTLAEANLSVSTGPVVDFRVKRHLRIMPGSGDVPLLYPSHFAGGQLQWPRSPFKKANAIALNAETSRSLYPSGFYVVVRRFSSKEEKRRIVANLIDPGALPPSPIGFENHLNVFHRNRSPLPEDIARGLAIYLNAKAVDAWFRQFNGHTQVNATDLRSMPYPNLDRLVLLGRWSKAHPSASPAEIDAKIETLE